uniref:Immediate early transactivator 1 n=1 Tax=Lymantria dispar multicapsid nuclear polyhedrosis virus TaxID=10449 RepID=A0A1B1MQP5_NPVLD|nr:immediate early transactivator 1 [Lymantria dispar multiple nucleopolyhedrovirus]
MFNEGCDPRTPARSDLQHSVAAFHTTHTTVDSYNALLDSNYQEKQFNSDFDRERQYYNSRDEPMPSFHDILQNNMDSPMTFTELFPSAADAAPIMYENAEAVRCGQEAETIVELALTGPSSSVPAVAVVDQIAADTKTKKKSKKRKCDSTAVVHIKRQRSSSPAPPPEVQQQQQPSLPLEQQQQQIFKRYRQSQIVPELNIESGDGAAGGNNGGNVVNAFEQAPLNQYLVDYRKDAQYGAREGGSNDKRFAEMITNTAYYMFVVCENDEQQQQQQSSEPQSPYKIFFVNCVWSVTQEYRRHFHHLDRMVMVVSFDKFRFMISYKLLKSMNIEIPQSEDLGRKLINNNDDAAQKNKCYFNEVKDFAFVALLINTFNLDMCYARAKISLVLAPLGYNKSKTIMKQIFNFMKDNTLFTLPFNFGRQEKMGQEQEEEHTNFIKMEESPYVDAIVKASAHFKFKTNPDKRVYGIDETLASLRFWLRAKNEKVTKDNFLYYKYGCVVRLFYDEQDKRIANLLRIKKDNNSTGHLLEEYLNACAKLPADSQNFLLLSTKTEERLTVVKNGPMFVWVTGIAKDILPDEHVKPFKQFKHHVFTLNKVNRKETNNKHNGLLKLISMYTGGNVPFDRVVEIAQNNFKCDYKLY